MYLVMTHGCKIMTPKLNNNHHKEIISATNSQECTPSSLYGKGDFLNQDGIVHHEYAPKGNCKPEYRYALLNDGDMF